MGIYNCADTLPEALDSLYQQTYQNFRIILCDDASTDETYKVAKSYADKYDNIYLMRNEQNLKLAATLNRCLEFVDTEFVARMDGDDVSLPTRFEKEIEFLDNNPDYALVSCAMIHFDESGDWGIGKPVEFPNKNDFKTTSPFAHAACMVRTETMKEVGGYTVNNLLERGQDYYLWYKIYKAGFKGYNFQEPLYKMRDGRDAIARRKMKNRYKAALIRYEVLKGLGVPNAFVYSFIGFTKAFIPKSLMSYIRKKRMNR